MCIQNAALVKQGVIKVQNLISPLAAANAGIFADFAAGLMIDIEEDRKMNGIPSWERRGLALIVLGDTGRWSKWQ